jgi:acetyltransferase
MKSNVFVPIPSSPNKPRLAQTVSIPRTDSTLFGKTPEMQTGNATFKSFPKAYITIRKISGVTITIRSIRAKDEPLMVEFHKTLSDYSVHFRYFGAVTLRQRTLHERLRRHCVLDHTREFALVADRTDHPQGHHQIFGVGRLIKEPTRNEAEFAILISDPWQGKGLGTELLRLLVRLGRQSHLRRIVGHILADNISMKRVSEKVGFKVHFRTEIGEWLAEMDL